MVLMRARCTNLRAFSVFCIAFPINAPTGNRVRLRHKASQSQTHRRISHLLPLADACPLWWSGPSSPPALCHRAFLGWQSRWATTAITVDFESDGKCMASPRGRTARTYRKRARTPLRAYAIAGTLPALDSFLSADRGGEATFVPRSGEREAHAYKGGGGRHMVWCYQTLARPGRAGSAACRRLIDAEADGSGFYGQWRPHCAPDPARQVTL